MSMITNALQYIKNTAGNGTVVAFMVDHDPVGAELWHELRREGLAYEDDFERIHLTVAGEQELRS